MSEVMENILTRRSIRNYKPEMVPREKIEQVIKAGVYAANGRGLQSPVIIAVTNREVRDDLANDNREIGGWEEGFDPFYGAPVVLIVLANKEVPTYLYDGSCTIENMLLAAHEMGLGSCWIHRAKEEFEMPKWKKWLESIGVKGDFEGIGHCILGYAGEEPKARPRNDGRVYFVD